MNIKQNKNRCRELGVLPKFRSKAFLKIHEYPSADDFEGNKISLRVNILKQLFTSGSVNIVEYSPRLCLGDYSTILTSPSANNC